jgi:hypothetical protein
MIGLFACRMERRLGFKLPNFEARQSIDAIFACAVRFSFPLLNRCSSR